MNVSSVMTKDYIVSVQVIPSVIDFMYFPVRGRFGTRCQGNPVINFIDALPHFQVLDQNHVPVLELLIFVWAIVNSYLEYFRSAIISTMDTIMGAASGFTVVACIPSIRLTA